MRVQRSCLHRQQHHRKTRRGPAMKRRCQQELGLDKAEYRTGTSSSSGSCSFCAPPRPAPTCSASRLRLSMLSGPSWLRMFGTNSVKSFSCPCPYTAYVLLLTAAWTVCGYRCISHVERIDRGNVGRLTFWAGEVENLAVLLEHVDLFDALDRLDRCSVRRIDGTSHGWNRQREKRGAAQFSAEVQDICKR